MATDFKSIGKNEQGALIAGGLSIILSFISSYVRASFSGGGIDVSSGTNAWHSYATLGILLVIIATAIIAVKVFAAENLPAGIPWNLAAAGAAALGAILLILRAVFPGGGGTGIDIGPGWSGYALFVTSIALAVFAFLGFKESGEKVQDFNRNNNNTPPAPPAA